MSLNPGVNLNQKDKSIKGPQLSLPNKMTLEEYHALITNPEANNVRYNLNISNPNISNTNIKEEILIEVKEENEDQSLFNQSSIRKVGYKVKYCINSQILI